MEGVQQKKIVDLFYVDPFFYKFSIITNVDLFKGYMNTIYVNETSLRFAIHYSRSYWKRNHFIN